MAGDRGSGTTSPARRALLVAPVVVAAALLAGPLGGVPAAAAPALSLSPTAGPPGSSVTVRGTDFAQCVEPDSGDTYVEVLWDGTPVLTDVEPASKGAFTATLAVPADATTGEHRVAARCWVRFDSPGPVLASAPFTVQPPPATPPPAADLRVTPDSGHAGDVVAADGTGFTACAADGTELLWDGTPLYTFRQHASGAFSVELTVPAGAGEHVVGARCAGTATPLATAPFRTLAGPAPTTTTAAPATAGNGATPGPTTAAPRPGTPTPSADQPAPTPSPTATGILAATGGDGGDAVQRGTLRAWVPATLPTRLDTGLADLARSLAIAVLLVLLVGFPAELFNSTVHENGDRIRRALARVTGRLPRGRALPTPVVLTAFTVVAATLTAFADRGAGLDRPTLVALAGLLVAIPVTLLAFEVPVELWCRRGGSTRAALRVLPAALLVAAVLSLASRLAGFEPAYVYGLVAGYAVLAGRTLTSERAGQAVLVGTASLLGVSMLAWAAWLSLGEPEGTLAAELTDSALAGVALVGVEGLVFALLPVRFLDGEALWQWGRRRWAVAYGIVAFVFVHLLLASRTERVDAAAVARMLALFAAFGVGSVAFWAWFRFRPETA
ncbi:MAG TPA: FGLLP motif-containing membrane protein [Frankiaceae bacterium]|nr:FGLLP motif-containing membrane protein [Frankiaceae bacterium]